jgi:RNA polymerase sigma factor (sigma-70 family)
MRTKAPDRLAKPAKPELVQYHRALHHFLLKRLRNTEDAADLAQEVYLRMLRVEDTELVRSPQDYLYGIASHVVYQFKLRARRDVVEFDSSAVEQAADHPAEIPTNDLAERIAAEQHLEWALGQLPPKQRTVLVLRKRDRLSNQEIAAQLKISTHTVKKYLFKAQARMRMLWQSAEKES